MKRIVIIVLLVSAITSFTFANGGSESGSEDLTIGFAFQGLESGFWVGSHDAITGYFEEKGINFIEKNGNEDANLQLEQVRDLITVGVDGILLIPQDGESALTIVGEANEAGIPIGVYNRPPKDDSRPALVVVADNKSIAMKSVEHLVSVARERFEETGEKITPLIMVGDLGDPNAVKRQEGFHEVVNANMDILNTPIEVPTKWDANVARANLQNAMQANPDVELIFTSSDFLYPVIRSVLAPLGKWKTVNEAGHLIIGGLDGDVGAAQLMRDGYIYSTGVQDVFYEAEVLIDSIVAAAEAGESAPSEWMYDPGFALTQDNMSEMESKMWGTVLLDQGWEP